MLISLLFLVVDLSDQTSIPVFLLQIISDFDRTLTKQHVDGKPTLSSFCT